MQGYFPFNIRYLQSLHQPISSLGTRAMPLPTHTARVWFSENGWENSNLALDSGFVQTLENLLAAGAATA